jgi:hypothetical protein
MAGAKAASDAAQEWDDSHNASLPEWKRLYPAQEEEMTHVRED